MTNRELREKRAKLITDAQVILRNDKRTAEDVANANRMLDDADVIKSEYEAVERADSMDAETRSVRPSNAPLPGNIDSPESRSAAESEAFRSYFQTGRLTSEQTSNLRSYDRTRGQVVNFRDMNGGITGGDTSGFLVPVGYQKEIETAMLAYGQQLTTVRTWKTDSGQPIQWPLSSDVTNFATEITDGTDVTEDDVALSQVTFNVSTFSTGLVKVSRSLITDSAFDMGSFLNDNFAVRMGRGLNRAITTGSTSGNVGSFVSAATSGGTSAAPTALSYVDLTTLYGSIDPAYIGNSTWSFNNNTLQQLMALVDSLGRPLFMPSLSSGVPDKILGRPFVLNQDLANVAAGTKSIFLGDWSKYVLRQVGGLEVLRLQERYAPSHQLAYVGFFRASAKLLDAGTHPIKFLTQHA
jgi:HK97 family phage major capsid protein